LFFFRHRGLFNQIRRGATGEANGTTIDPGLGLRSGGGWGSAWAGGTLQGRTTSQAVSGSRGGPWDRRGARRGSPLGLLDPAAGVRPGKGRKAGTKNQAIPPPQPAGRRAAGSKGCRSQAAARGGRAAVRGPAPLSRSRSCCSPSKDSGVDERPLGTWDPWDPWETPKVDGRMNGPSSCAGPSSRRTSCCSP
jgi:hypothetical protein